MYVQYKTASLGATSVRRALSSLELRRVVNRTYVLPIKTTRGCQLVPLWLMAIRAAFLLANVEDDLVGGIKSVLCLPKMMLPSRAPQAIHEN